MMQSTQDRTVKNVFGRLNGSGDHGPIVDRSNEKFVSTENGIIMARHRLIRASKLWRKMARYPPGVALPYQQVRAASIVLGPDEVFQDATREELSVRKGFAHASV